MRPPPFPDGFDPSLPPSEQAFFWVIYLESGTCTDEDHVAFDTWLESDDQHGAAFREAEQLWRSVGKSLAMDAPPRPIAAASPVAPKGRNPIPARLGVWMAGATLLAACIGIAALVSPSLNNLPPGSEAVAFASVRYSTPIGEIRRVELADGSEIVLGGDTVVEVTLSDTHRDAVVIQGQAYFNVMREPARPFQVVANMSKVSVLGTAFDVRLGRRETTISVVEGRVSVAGTGISSTTLAAGEKISVGETGQLEEIRAFNPSEVLGWQERRFYFEDTRLEELVADLNRYSDKPIELDGAGLEDLNISASFNLDQSREMLAGLAAALSLVIVEETDRVILRHPA